ncbi:MAG: zinc-dependent metalloprotease [Niastella sp.]|nr:zinc-dependent metalloprotease [Niastella sp.]
MSKKVQKLLSGGMLMAIICCAHTGTIAQQKDRRRSNPQPVVGDTSQKKDNSAALKAASALLNARTDGPKPYKEVITAKAVSYKSFLTVHKIDEKYFMEIPDAMLGREILAINRIGVAPADFRGGGVPIGYAGDVIGQQVFHFAKGDGNRLFIRTRSYRERSMDSSANGLARSLERNNMEPIVNSFTVKAVNDSTHTTVIEITDLLGQDNNLFGFSATTKSMTGLQTVLTDRSFLDSVKSYQDNLSFTFMRTYNRTGRGLGAPTQPYTFQLHTGMILLPDVPMAARLADKRTGWNSMSYIDFDNNPIGVTNKEVIVRWRLEPSDRQAYLAGKLTTPARPVKMYIDPAMPAKWKPSIKAGIEAWNKAFEKAGFKNAIEVEQPVASTGTSFLDNVQRSAVVFMPGTGKTPGSIVVDPRSGEILQVQLNFYLSTLDTLYKQYFIQAGALDKAANKPVFDDALMGKLVETYTMQIMGRLLGLKVNAGASFGNKITDLRNNSWLSEHAFNGSVTDPVLVNYVVQPTDKVDVGNLLPRISETDEWMINWGYRIVPGDENTALNKWIREFSKPAVQKLPDYSEPYIGDAPTNLTVVSDPRNQLGDLSNDVTQAAILGISNLKKIVPHLVEWTSEPATGNERAGEMYEALLNQYTAYTRYVLNQLGGVYTNVRNSDQPGHVFSFVPQAVQKKSLLFLHQQVFETPSWLADKNLYSRTIWRFDSVMNIQRAMLDEVMSAGVLSRLQVVVVNDAASAYTPMAFMNDLSAGIFSELNNNQPVSLPRRELQQEYITRLQALINAFVKSDNDLPAVLGAHARKLLGMLKQKQPLYTGINQAHVNMLYERLYAAIYKNESTAKKN